MVWMKSLINFNFLWVRHAHTTKKRMPQYTIKTTQLWAPWLQKQTSHLNSFRPTYTLYIYNMNVLMRTKRAFCWFFCQSKWKASNKLNATNHHKKISFRHRNKWNVKKIKEDEKCVRWFYKRDPFEVKIGIKNYHN